MRSLQSALSPERQALTTRSVRLVLLPEISITRPQSPVAAAVFVSTGVAPDLGAFESGATLPVCGLGHTPPHPLQHNPTVALVVAKSRAVTREPSANRATPHHTALARTA